MTNQLKDDSKLVKRTILLDGLKALYLTQSRFDRLLKEDSYACGYREGFEDALLSIAQVLGVSDEFEITRQSFNSYKKVNGTTIHNTNTMR